MKAKVKSQRGETLVETLVSVLIIILASVMLYGMAASAAKMNRQASEQDAAFYGQLTSAETNASSTQASLGSVQIKETGGSFQKAVDVIFYQESLGGEDVLRSYIVLGE